MMMMMRNKTILVIAIMAILSIGLMLGTTRMMTAAGSTNNNNNTSEFADYTIVIRDPGTGEEEEITSTGITHERCLEIVKSFEEDGYDVISNKNCEPDDSSSSDDT
jgi:maltose-binding protein MalE